VPPLRTHKIVDGDTLEALASAYLGSADRWLEIYELNRHVLPSPALLPIGVQLKIPPLGPQAAQ
jgi:nucleoid-associated protein YgaU